MNALILFRLINFHNINYIFTYMCLCIRRVCAPQRPPWRWTATSAQQCCPFSLAVRLSLLAPSTTPPSSTPPSTPSTACPRGALWPKHSETPLRSACCLFASEEQKQLSHESSVQFFKWLFSSFQMTKLMLVWWRSGQQQLYLVSSCFAGTSVPPCCSSSCAASSLMCPCWLNTARCL